MTKKERMFQLVFQQEESDLTVADFCKQHAVKMSVFNYWKSKQKKELDSHVDKGFFVSIDNPDPRIDTDIVITYPNGVTINIPSTSAAISTIQSLIQLQS